MGSEQAPLLYVVEANLSQRYHAFLRCYLFPSAVNLPGISIFKIGITTESGRGKKHYATTIPNISLNIHSFPSCGVTECSLATYFSFEIIFMSKECAFSEFWCCNSWLLINIRIVH